MKNSTSLPPSSPASSGKRRPVQTFFMFIFALIFLGTGAWGVFDARMFSAMGGDIVGSVGNMPVKSRDVLLRYQEVAPRLPRNIPPQLVKQMVVSDIIDRLSLYQYVYGMGVRVSDAQIVAEIQGLEAFKDEKGTFSREIFETSLKEAGFTEKEFVEDIRLSLVNTLFSKAVSPQSYLSRNIAQHLYKSQQEKRAVQVMVLETSLMTAQVKAPTPEEMTAFYDQNKARFQVPERRTVAYLPFTYDDFLKKTQVSDEEVKGFYEKNIDQFRVPEKRKTYQLSFPSREKALETLPRLKEGKSFLDSAKSAGFQLSEIDLGEIAQNALPKELGEALFAVSEQKMSVPLETPFGWVVYYVDKALPAHTAPLAEVQPKITADLKKTRAEEALNRFLHEGDEAFSGGTPLEKIAQEKGLTLGFLRDVSGLGVLYQGNIPQTDEKGIVPAADESLLFKDTVLRATLVKKAFSLEVGGDPVLMYDDQKRIGFFYQVREMKKTEQPPLEEVRTLVEQAFRNQQEDELLNKKTLELVEAINQKKQTLEAIGQQLQVKVETAEFLPSDRTGLLGASSMEELFKAPLGTAVMGKSPSFRSQAIAVAQKVIPAEMTGEKAQKNIEQVAWDFVANQVPASLRASMLEEMRKSQKMHIDSQAIEGLWKRLERQNP